MHVAGTVGSVERMARWLTATGRAEESDLMGHRRHARWKVRKADRRAEGFCAKKVQVAMERI